MPFVLEIDTQKTGSSHKGSFCIVESRMVHTSIFWMNKAHSSLAYEISTHTIATCVQRLLFFRFAGNNRLALLQIRRHLVATDQSGLSAFWYRLCIWHICALILLALSQSKKKRKITGVTSRLWSTIVSEVKCLNFTGNVSLNKAAKTVSMWTTTNACEIVACVQKYKAYGNRKHKFGRDEHAEASRRQKNSQV